MGVNEDSFTIGGRWTNQMDKAATQVQGRANNPWQGQARSLYDQYNRVLQGQTPSIAQQQMQQGLQSAIAGQRSMAASASPLARAAMERAAANNVAGLQQGMVSQGAMLRAQEQDAARQGMAGLAGTMGQQSLGQQGMNDSMVQFYMNQGFSRDQAQQQALAQMEQIKSNNAATSMTGLTSILGQAREPTWSEKYIPVVGSTISAAGQVGAASVGNKK
jgi:hypothetical protein